MTSARHCLLLIGALLAAACGPKPLPQESQFDTAANHCRMGLSRLDSGDLAAAQGEFDRARQLDPEFAGSYVGSALVAMERREFDRAREHVGTALSKDEDLVDAYVAQGRIATEEGLASGSPSADWLKKALSAYEKAAKKAADDPSVPYYRGQSYKKAFQFQAARESFAEVLAHNRGPYVERAAQETETIQRIERAAPGTEIGMKIALVPILNRGELAVLLLQELKLKEVIAKRRPATTDLSFRAPGQEGAAAPTAAVGATDIAGHWAQQWIEELLALDVPGLRAMPDGTFQPNQPLTRAEYAMVNQSVIAMITGDRTLATRFLGEPSRFSDVRSDYYAYNAIALNADRGIMAADKISGAFRPEDPVSGADALLIIRDLQHALRMEF